MLKRLVRADLLHAGTGPRGGFRLARDPAEVTVLEIVEAVEGGTPLFRCTEIRQRGPVPASKSACQRENRQLADARDQPIPPPAARERPR